MQGVKREGCLVEGCNNKHFGKGYCNKHYSRLKRNGTLETKTMIDHPKECTVEGCTNKYHAKGLCIKHYNRYLKYDDTSYTKTEKHSKNNTTEYYVWSHMKARCYNPNNKKYHRYGGRGITVCDRWKNSFLNFYEDMGDRPEGKNQIDRINNDGNYEPTNCRWVTYAENNRNRSTTKLTIEKAREIREKYKNEAITQTELSHIYLVSIAVINQIIHNKIWKEIK